MDRNSIPTLPFNLVAQHIYWYTPEKIAVDCFSDDKVVYRFYWDGFSTDFISHDVFLKVDLNNKNETTE